MPLIVRFCKEEDDELREYCLQAFESFVKRCPKEILPFMPEVRGFVSSVLLNIVVMLVLCYLTSRNLHFV